MCVVPRDTAFCSLYPYVPLQLLLPFACSVELVGEPLPSSNAPNSVKLFCSSKRIGEVLSFTCCKNAALELIVMVLWVPLWLEKCLGWAGLCVGFFVCFSFFLQCRLFSYVTALKQRWSLTACASLRSSSQSHVSLEMSLAGTGGCGLAMSTIALSYIHLLQHC